MTDERCSRRNKDGSPCNAQPWKDGTCRWHHPDSQVAIAEGRRKGGRRRSNQARAKAAIPEAMTSEELAGWLSATFKSVLSGRTEPGIGTACATIARTLLAANEAGALARIEERLTDLERSG